MSDNPVQALLQAALSSLSGMADLNSAVGKPIETADGTTIVPIGKVNYGYAAGGSEYNHDSAEGSPFPFGGGIGGGVSITPTAFLVIGKSGAQLLPLDMPKDIYSRLIELAPQLLDILRNGADRGSTPRTPGGDDGYDR